MQYYQLKEVSMAIHLTVPLIRQIGPDTCWHAAGRMLWAYKYQQSINPLPQKFFKKGDKGLSQYDIPDLASSLGLKPVSEVCAFWSATKMASLISDYGPLFTAGNFLKLDPDAFHAIVLTGADETTDKIYYNDPWDATEYDESIYWFINHKSTTDQLQGSYFQPVLWYLP